MCGRFVTALTAEDIVGAFDADHDGLADWRESYQIRPTDPTPIIVDSVKDDVEPTRRAELARWSLVPSWSKQLKLPFPTFNARSEDVADKPAFRDSVVSRRALIPATGYYEWRTDGAVKTPHFVHFADGQPMTFAGLYSWWVDPAKAKDDPSRWVLSATILTMAAVPHLADIHDRTPVTLPTEWWDDWLDPTIEGDQYLVDAAVEASRPVAEQLEAYVIAPLPQDGDGPELIRPLGDATPPTEG